MALIVAHKHMKLPKSIALTCCAILALSANGLSAKAAETRAGNSRRTFADWCRQKADLSPEAKRTVELLLQKAKTTECNAANLKLSSLTYLDLDNNKISDIKPLQSLTNLTRLELEKNQISDIKPLQSLTNLTLLALGHNQISDIKPVQSLTKLTLLALGGNQISDIKPLQSLTNLTMLGLSGNQISDIKPPAPTSPIAQTRLTSRHDLDHIAEKLAVPSQSHPLAGFWKDGDCSDDFGLAIAPAGKGLYSVSFCGPGGCFVPGTYRPNSRIVGDRSYRVVNNNTIDVEGRDGFTRSIRCPSR